MIFKLLTEHHLELSLILKGGCTGSADFTLVKMPHCWKSHVLSHMYFSGCVQLVPECFAVLLEVLDSVSKMLSRLDVMVQPS